MYSGRVFSNRLCSLVTRGRQEKNGGFSPGWREAQTYPGWAELRAELETWQLSLDKMPEVCKSALEGEILSSHQGRVGRHVQETGGAALPVGGSEVVGAIVIVFDLLR
jgi:hypothetical protein